MDLSFDKMKNLGALLRGKFTQYEKDRRPVEEQWAKNLRQYLRQYDPDVLENIPDDKSQSYPGDTRVKVKAKVAKMMEMMFPSQERNWDLAVTPVPSIPEDALQKIIDELTEAEKVAALQEQRDPQPVSSDAIEYMVKQFATKRKDNMEEEIADQLDDPMTDYVQLCKRVVRSGTIYGAGVARTGQVRTMEERVWELGKSGRYEAVVKKQRRPYPEYRRIWNIYPDLSALTWEEQEGLFDMYVFNRHDFAQLAKRPDFRGDVINEYLRQHRDGNYVTRTFETELIKLTSNYDLAARNKRRYQVYRWFGFVSAHDLVEAGIEVTEAERSADILADVWIIDDVVIKAEKATFGKRVSDQYHAYIPAEDEDAGLTGVGLPEDVRDSQMAVCAVTRALMDNLAASAGPILEVNTDLLPAGSKVDSIHAFMTILREGQGAEAQTRAIHAIDVPLHAQELLAVLNMQRQQLDVESNLPAWTFGQLGQQNLGEGFRTSGNFSQMMGGANMVTKDDVRAFDRFTTGVIGSFLRWNMDFNPREDIKGDFQARAKGTLSLVAKEIRGAALDQFIATLSPEDRAMFDMYGINLDRLKSRDLPTDRLLPRDEAMKMVEQMKQAQAAAAQSEQNLTAAKAANLNASAKKNEASAQVTMQTADALRAEMLSRVDANIAQAKTMRDRTQLENLKTLLEQGLQGQEVVQ